VHQAARITAAARRRFIQEALAKHLPATLFCGHGRSVFLSPFGRLRGSAFFLLTDPSGAQSLEVAPPSGR
jgi:hypothetical protein